MEDSGNATTADRLQAIQVQAKSLVKQLQALTSTQSSERLAWLLDLIVQVQDLLTFCSADPADATAAAKKTPAATRKQLKAFGQLLRDRRNAAGLSRLQLASRAKLSDATVKFVETARHPASRATLIRLLAVKELGLTWADAPGAPTPPSPAQDLVVERPPLSAERNGFLTPTFDPVRQVLDLGRFLNGAGGHVDQASAYLDHQSAAAYLALCRQSAALADLRARTPLYEAARLISATAGRVGLQVIALGSGEAALEVRLVQDLLDQAHPPHIDFCLLDASQPLLACGQKHAAEILASFPQVHVWGMQCHFAELPLYSRVLSGTQKPLGQRRVFCLLGGTFGDLDNEPRFFQHALPACTRGDLLLLDIPQARGSTLDPAELKRREKLGTVGLTPAEAAWLSGPIWRHVQDVASVDFHWNLQTECPIAGSYAREAVAVVQLRTGAPRQFSMFRFRRYAPEQVAACLFSLGWDEIAAMPFGSADHPSSLRLFCKRAESQPHG